MTRRTSAVAVCCSWLSAERAVTGSQVRAQGSILRPEPRHLGQQLRLRRSFRRVHAVVGHAVSLPARFQHQDAPASSASIFATRRGNSTGLVS